LSWNGKISEITAALALEQVKNFNIIQNKVLDNANKFEKYIERFEKIKTMSFPNKSKIKRSYNQLRLKVDFKSPLQKELFVTKIRSNGIEVYDGNFEPLPVLSFFKEREWEKWTDTESHESLKRNYNSDYFKAGEYFRVSGIGIHRNNFLSTQRLKSLIKIFTQAYSEFL
jgi:dTDP-4-amino-4,6-dideoxygalactose transaminase